MREAAQSPEPLLRRMEDSDLEGAMELDALCMSSPWSEGVWRGELRSPFGLYLLFESGGTISAQIGVKHVAGELHLVTLAVRPGLRRRGYARALFDAALGAFPKASRVYLEVRPTNEAARALYEALGFRVSGLRRWYYGDEDALLMTLDLEEGRRASPRISP